MLNIAFTEKRQKKLKEHWDSEIASLKAHEAIVQKKITEKEAEITGATVIAVEELHKATKEKLLETLIDTVRERNNCELKLHKWY